jgi:hypothetical protein
MEMSLEKLLLWGEIRRAETRRYAFPLSLARFRVLKNRSEVRAGTLLRGSACL